MRRSTTAAIRAAKSHHPPRYFLSGFNLFSYPTTAAIRAGRLGWAGWPPRRFDLGSTTSTSPANTPLYSPPDCVDRRRRIEGGRPTSGARIHRINPRTSLFPPITATSELSGLKPRSIFSTPRT